ncbi:hypothetical protein FACS189442_2900 [Spirochaetia bacterium]|nr:hypothetical protein FACS189442_2900 [Spirochaetia bacterium]
MIRNYIDGIYNTILIKDVANREHINDISLLESIVQFLASGIGSPVSAKKISDTLLSIPIFWGMVAQKERFSEKIVKSFQHD